MSKHEAIMGTLRKLGFGGEYSWFRVTDLDGWVTLANVDRKTEPAFAFTVYDSTEIIDELEEITTPQASRYYRDDEEWTSTFSAVQKIITMAVKALDKVSKIKYYVDHEHESVYLVGGTYAIELAPVED